MIDPILKVWLEPVVRRRRQYALSTRLASVWAGAALAGAGLLGLEHFTGHLPVLAPLVLLAAAAFAFWFWRQQRDAEADWRGIARNIEQGHPELHALLLTAVEQQTQAGGRLNYLQQRVVQEAVQHALHHRWITAIPKSRLALAYAANAAALALLLLVCSGLRQPGAAAPRNAYVKNGLTITPGDATIERGENLVVLARFDGALPAAVDMVINSARKQPLVKSLGDPVFGGSIAEVTESFVYHLEYGGRTTRDFTVKVFEHPKLERADAELSYPEYTGQPRKRIENTRRISAVESSRMDLALQLNKPVAGARLVGKDKSVIPLTMETNRAVASLKGFQLAASQTYTLQLIDSEGRTNKQPAQFTFEVSKNRKPELKLVSPKGDVRPSALEELTFQGEVWDDFGVRAYGLAYAVPGQPERLIEMGRNIPGRQKKAFSHLLALESLGVQPDQLVSYYLWAEDIGPDGQPRRTSSDMYFAEVRPFDEIYREKQAESGESSEESPESQPQGNQSAKLAELQKQIISATWKLQRENGPASATPKYREDAGVVRESQAQALEQAEGKKEDSPDPRSQALWGLVAAEMDKALQRLNDATNTPAPLPQALNAEQAAYQALLKLQAREHEVARQKRQQNQRSSASQQQRDKQLQQLELAEEENRYETQKQAAKQMTQERKEQLQTLNRLQELARRQQDLNERLKELQTALQEAKTEAEREEIRHRLKRLREEEQQMLGDIDELQQRMERSQNPSQMADQRSKLEQVRDQVQKAAESMDKGAVSPALASGTRAQRDLQEMRETLRKQNANQFAEDMRQMRSAARDVAKKEDEIAKNLENLKEPRQKSLTDSPQRNALTKALANQQQRMTNLLNQAAQVSEQAENAEPLLSKQLYDTLRKFNQNDAKNLKDFREELLRNRQLTQGNYQKLKDAEEAPGSKSLEAADQMLRQGNLANAAQAEKRARASMNEFKDGVEHAAESVLGDEAESLRQARKQIDELTKELDREMAQAEGKNNEPPAPGQAEGTPRGASSPKESQGKPSRPGEASAQRPAGQPNQTAQAGRENQPRPGEPASPGNQPPSGQPNPRDAARNEPAQAMAGNQPPSGQPGENARGNPREGAPRLDRLDRGQRNLTSNDGRGGLVPRGEFWNAGPLNWNAPLTGNDFTPWSDRMREVEEMLDYPEWRNEVATARERARQLRVEYKRSQKKPDWAVVRQQIVSPLAEVSKRIGEELARRESRDALAPLDRDPVPARYSELVRRYYEDLGKDKK